MSVYGLEFRCIFMQTGQVCRQFVYTQSTSPAIRVPAPPPYGRLVPIPFRYELQGTRVCRQRVMAVGEPPAKRRRRCSNRSDFLEEEEWSEPVECSTPVWLTPVWQLDGRSSEFDPKEELEGSFLDGDANGIASDVEDGGDAHSIASEVGLDYLGLNEESIG